MKVNCSLKIGGLFVVLPLAFSVAHADVDAGYEAAKRPSGSYNPTCPKDYDLSDSWGFYTCECTSYVAYRLRLNDVRLDGELFDDTWGNTHIHWGGGGKWNVQSKLDAAGIHQDQYPAVGSVANDTVHGHVAYVQRLWTRASDGRLESIDVMEYNWPMDHLYHYRNIKIGGSGYPTSFLHFEEKGRDADITNATCVTGIAPPSGSSPGTFCWVHNGSNASCADASAYYYYDYRTCHKYAVSRQKCGDVGTNRGYIAHIDDWFPEPIDPAHRGEGFATCDAGGSAYGGTSTDNSISNYLLE